MPTEPLTIAKSKKDGIEYLLMTGPLTLADLFEFQDAIRGAMTPKTILDLSGVSYMDSAGLGAILSFHASCNRHEHKYAIAGASQRLMTLFEVAKVVGFLNLYPTMAEAEATLR